MRLTGVAQSVKSAAQILRRPVARVHLPVLERLGLPECPYVHRWRFEIDGLGSLRVHHWLGEDDDRAFHDHPWWFVTFVFRGAYADHNEAGTETLTAPCIRFRPAEYRHYVVPVTSGCWTLLLTGPKTRNWGFWPDGKFRKANKWFASRGHHPCS